VVLLRHWFGSASPVVTTRPATLFSRRPRPPFTLATVSTLAHREVLAVVHRRNTSGLPSGIEANPVGHVPGWRRPLSTGGISPSSRSHKPIPVCSVINTGTLCTTSSENAFCRLLIRAGRRTNPPLPPQGRVYARVTVHNYS
jgi:hypothetical protein